MGLPGFVHRVLDKKVWSPSADNTTKGMHVTYRLTTSLPLGRLALRCGVRLAIVALLCKFFIGTRAQGGLLTVLLDRIPFVVN